LHSSITDSICVGITTSTKGATMADADKVRENRARRAAARQGFKLIKSKRRDPRALDYSTWTIINSQTGAVEKGDRMTIDDVEQFLNRPRTETFT
jgi:hypothetical protein